MISLTLCNLFEKFLLIRDIRKYPLDLKIAFIWTLVSILCVYLPFLQDSLLRPVFGVVFILVVPGYLFTAALFPASDDIEGIERIALTFGLSVAIVPLIGLGLNYTPWGIRLTPIVTALVIFTLVMTGIAAYRRLILPEENRFIVPIHETIQVIRNEFFPDHTTRIDRALSMLLFGAIVLLLVTTIFVILFPQDGERFTEFYILGERDKAADYPTTFWNGTRQEVTIGIGNHEHRNVTYDVEIFGLNQKFDTSTNTSKILKAVPLGSYLIEVAHNQTVERSFPFIVNNTSINRIQFLLFDDIHRRPKGDVAVEEIINSSYRDLHFWVKVDEAQPFFRVVYRVIKDKIINNNRVVDISGEWIFTSGPNTGEISFFQVGNEFIGNFKFPQYNFEDKVINGVISGNTITFKRVNYLASQDFCGTCLLDSSGEIKILGTFTDGINTARWEARKNDIIDSSGKK